MKRQNVAQMMRNLGAKFITLLIAICMLAAGLAVSAGAASAAPVTTKASAATTAPKASSLPAGEAAGSSGTTPAADLAAVQAARQAQKGVTSADVSPVVVTLGFDDGRASVAKEGSVLSYYGLSGTFYLISGSSTSAYGLDKSGFLTQAQAKDLAARGNEIGGHTRTHPDVATLSTADQTTEICGGRQDLINDGFAAPVSFAYPYGSFNASAEAVAASCPFTNARTTLLGGPDSIPPAVPMATTATLYPVSTGPDAAGMKASIIAAENNGTSNKWLQILWHDIVTPTDLGWNDGFSQTEADFKTLLAWLQTEKASGRIVVKTAGQAMQTAPPIVPRGAISAEWTAKGGAGGILGNPVNNEYDVPGVTGARMEDFVGGKIYWSPTSGAHEVHGAILGKYLEQTPANFGLPETDENITPDGVGRFNHFQNGHSIYWNPSTNAHTVYGSIRAEWQALGWELGVLGYPTTDELDALAPGRYNGFQRGMIYWSPTTAAHEVHGAILTAWAGQGYEHGQLGFPITDEFAITGGRQSTFAHGYITWLNGQATIH